MWIMPAARTPVSPGSILTSLGAVLCSLGLATGCSSVGPDVSRSGSVARSFHEAVANDEPAAACELLAPRTREELEESANTSCSQALADAGLPDATTVTAADVYGANARVVLDGDTGATGDTVFLARFGAQWKVTAAGCKARPDLPYDCDVNGG